MTNNIGNLSNLRTYNGTDKIIASDGSHLTITHVGNTTKSRLKVKEILVVPKLNKNLLFVSKLAKDNSCTPEFDEFDFVVRDKKPGKWLASRSKKR